ncbi:uncharacterized protein LOC126911614 [Spodoptera frugiperda]|uniref:Uncharacterized protein LOC126911614 n=1 Tax=Spodoptera frugiperda TaxID=7108 RepID=A0A9R0DY23_SPOFR|nr:uncharacterized protein LOC126911614 [Spodoptera frugiperda]
MADNPTPGSSKHTSNKQEIIPRSAPEKLRIIRRLAKQIRHKPKKFTFTKNTIYEVTGLHPENLRQLYLFDSDLIEPISLDRSIVYKTWAENCIKFKLLTTEQLFWALNAKNIPVYMDIGDFRKWLYKNDFMWIPGFGGDLVVIECTEARFERYLYLQNMARYRAENKQIFFIDHATFNSKGRLVTLKESNAVLKNDERLETYQRILFAVSEAGSDCLQYVEGFTEKVFLDWINQVFLIAVGRPSVVVLSYDKHHSEEIIKVPTSESTKRDLCKWLDYFNVPYDAEMTKLTLHELIQKYTDLTEKMYAVDAVLKANGHTVLRIPNCIRKLTPATYYSDMVDLNMKVNFVNETSLDKEVVIENIGNIFETCSPHEAWAAIIKEEQSILAMDSSVDEFINEIKGARIKSILTPERIANIDSPSDDSDSE